MAQLCERGAEAGTPPVILAVSLDLREVLAPWRRDAMGGARSSPSAGPARVGAAPALPPDRRQAGGRGHAGAGTRGRVRPAPRHESAAGRNAGARKGRPRGRGGRERDQGPVPDDGVTRAAHAAHGHLGLGAHAARRRHHRRTAEAALQTIERNAQTQTRLISDLLDGSSVISGKLRLDVRKVRISESPCRRWKRFTRRRKRNRSA